MIAQAKNQMTTVEELRKHLRNRFQEAFENEVQGPSDTLMELVCDPVESEKYPLFASLVKEGTTARRGALRSGGAERVASPTSYPPLTSRGVTIPKPTETQKQKILGGYDGGVEIGYNGNWNERKFKQLLEQLETARTSAENEKSDDRFVTLHDLTFSVNAHGANCGAHYKYVLSGMGMKIFIHANPKGPIQAIRIRYGFESLCGRDLFAVHANILEWLQKLGFKVEKETLSRIDMQVMIFRKVVEFVELFMRNHVVRRAKTHQFHGSSSKPITSMTLGKQIQLCIYDKRQELFDTRDEVKLNMLMKECLGGELPDELTRIEFRLRREGLKYFGINTMQDLLEKEHALVDYLTFDWFRLLESEKKSEHGHERRQAIHSLWQEVRDLFFEYFPGSSVQRKPIEHNNSRRELKCTGEDLVKQAVGCLATAAAVVKGVFENEASALSYVYEVLSENVKKLFVRTTERVKELGIIRGVEAPNAMDWHLDPRYACGSTEEALKEFRVVFDEDLQYERVRNYAVEGCPF